MPRRPVKPTPKPRKTGVVASGKRGMSGRSGGNRSDWAGKRLTEDAGRTGERRRGREAR